jgi:alpha-glucosidase
MRNHSAIGTRDQECYQFENSEDFKSIVEVRYRLLPYLYSEYVKSCAKNQMYFRPLSFDYPEDSRCLEINDQLMLGNEIMIAPVYTQNAKGRMIYLPEDMILVRFMPDGSIQQSEISAGDHYIQVALNEVVMFVKKGCVIPVGKPAQNSDKLDYENLELIGDVSSKAFYSLYKDDGYTTQIDLDKNTKQIK